MNPLQREYVMIALLGAGLETRPFVSRKKDTARRGPGGPKRGIPKVRSFSGELLKSFDGDCGIPFFFAPIAQLASQLSLLLVSPF